MATTNTKEYKQQQEQQHSSEIKEKIKKVYKTISPFEETPHDDYTWEELQGIEKHRRRILTRVEDGFWKILSYWDGTCLQILLFDSLLWIVMGIYAAIRVQARLSVPGFVADIASGDINVIGGFLSFFLVFFVNQNHKRYFGLYDKTMASKGRIFDVATLAAAYLPKEVASRLVRYMNAAHTAGYVGLSKTYPSHTFFDEINKELRLLTDEEYKRMKEVGLDKGGSCNRELIAWCMAEIHRMHKQGVLDHQLAEQFRSQILGLRASIGLLYNAADLPIPFFYVHFICLLTVLYLPLFAISTAYGAGTGDDVYWTADVVGGLVVLTQTIFVQGLRILGQKMTDPFGDDKIDLSVIHFTIFNWRMSNRVLNSTYPSHDADLEEEKDLAKDTIDIGAAWQKKEDEKAEAGQAGLQVTSPSPQKPSNLKDLGDAETWKQEKHD